MPFKSKAQQRAMEAKASQGEIPKKTINEFEQSTNFGILPERVGHTSGKPKKKKPMTWMGGGG